MLRLFDDCAAEERGRDHGEGEQDARGGGGDAGSADVGEERLVGGDVVEIDERHGCRDRVGGPAVEGFEIVHG